MRVVLIFVEVILTLGLASQPMHGQTPAADASALVTIRMVAAQTGWAILIDKLSGASALLRTTDGGTHWRDVTPLTSSGSKIRVLRITVLSPLIAWVVPVNAKDSATAELFHTTDGGRSWRRAVIPAAGAISFINPREGWLMTTLRAGMGIEENEVYRSTDGGDNWLRVARATTDDNSSGLTITGPKIAVTFLDSVTGWITGLKRGGDWLNLHVTRDGGYTWRQQNVPLPREVMPHWDAWPEPPKFFTAQDGILPILYSLANDSGQIAGRVVVFYTTHDGGTTWKHTAPVRVNVKDQAYQTVADMNHAWVLNGDVLHATSDGGRQWTKMPPNPLLADVIQLDFISPKVGWAVRNRAFYAGGTPTFPFLLKTLDGGRTWAPVTYTVSR